MWESRNNNKQGRLPNSVEIVRTKSQLFIKTLSPYYFSLSDRSAAPGSVLSGGHQTRPFSPYRHAPTNEDLMHAAARNRAMIIPEESSRAPSHRSKTPSAVAPPLPLSPPTSPKAKPIKAPSHISTKQPSVAPSAVRTAVTNARRDANATPTPAHPGYPDEQELNAEEQRLVRDALTRTTPRTSHYSPSVVGTEVLNSHFHDGELCALFKELDNTQGSEAVKKAVRKAVRQRVKKLGMKHDEGVNVFTLLSFSILMVFTVNTRIPKATYACSHWYGRGR